MNKHFIIFSVFIAVNILHAEPGDNKNQLGENGSQHSMLYFQYKSDSIITDYYSRENRFSLFNYNVNFSNRHHTYNSLLKMSGETLSGGVLGFVLGAVMYNAFRPKAKGDGSAVGKLIQLAFTSVGVAAGTTYGTYYCGKLVGDEGEIKNIIFWMTVGGVITSSITGVFSSNENTKLWLTLASLPIGAAFGFNTNDLNDLIFPVNK